tara:strand:- start:2365 stop:2580 length:216 start_codon:yes stop_codon:yes gene_type:complete
MNNFRDELIGASIKHFEAQIAKHKINIDVLMENGVGVAEHPDIMETIEKELAIMAEYEDKLAVLKKYFVNN